jgi:hypothetical protein
MTTTPTIEKTEDTKCCTCGQKCFRLCTKCGSNFCTKHLLVHSERCSGYKKVISAILKEGITDATEQVVQAILTI